MNGPLRRNPYAAIVRAAEQGVGVRLAPEEAALLAADPTIAARARLAANVTRAPRAGDDRARLPRPATYGRDRFGHLHYGDPPNIHCCAAGPTMNSIPIRVLEYWSRENPLLDWQRDPALEVEITPEWASETEAGA